MEIIIDSARIEAALKKLTDEVHLSESDDDTLPSLAEEDDDDE